MDIAAATLPQPVTETEHRRQWAALRQLSTALKESHTPSRVYGQISLCLKAHGPIDIPQRHAPFLGVVVRAGTPDLVVRVEGGFFMWEHTEGNPWSVPTGEVPAAAQAVITTIQARTPHLQ